MDTGENMNPGLLKTTTDYPVTLPTPASNCTALLILLHALFPTKKLLKHPEQDLEPDVTWGQNNFNTDGPPNPMESKTMHEEHVVKKTMDKREIHESLRSMEELLHRIRRRAAGEVDEELPRLYTELQKRYEAIRRLTKELEQCKKDNNGARQPKDINLLAQLTKKENEITELSDEISRLSITSQEEQKQIVYLEAQNSGKDEKLRKLSAQVDELQEHQKKTLDLITQNARKDETIRHLERQVAKLQAVEQNLLKLHAENSRKDQEILHLKSFAEQLQQFQRSASDLSAENSRKDIELLQLKTYLQQVEQAKEACEQESGIGRIMRKKQEFVNRLFGG